MAHVTIPVDLFNPGQVFACIGFLEVADQLFGDAQGGFDWSRNSDVVFHLSVAGDNNPVREVLDCISSSRIVSLAPEGTDLSTVKWDVETRLIPVTAPFPMAVPDSPATLPALLEFKHEGNIVRIVVDHWGDSTTRDNVKFWAGAGGYPGVGLFRDGLNLFRGAPAEIISDPFSHSVPQSSSFRFDWRRDYIPLDAGFSPNEHGNMTMLGFPIVELLAAIGLTNARPRRAQRSKLEYRYSVLGINSTEQLYAPIFLRAALGGAKLGFPHRVFNMQLGWPGKENQARCITNVIEEN